MERPKPRPEQIERKITGEVIYFDQARRMGQVPKEYESLSDMALQMYETEADMCAKQGVRPSIMEEYERYDAQVSEAQASCLALSDELLALKGDSPLSFVDLSVNVSAEEVMSRVKQCQYSELLAGDDDQLAMPSNGEYYPMLDVKKSDARLTGIGLRVWGWDDDKYVFTNKSRDEYDMSKHFLRYPSDEKVHRRQIEISFGYDHPEAGSIVESLSLNITSMGQASMHSQIYMGVYAETGYEGHGGVSKGHVSDRDMVMFGDLTAEIVGDMPESVRMRDQRELQEMIESAATMDVRQAVERLIECTWPAQARYLLGLSGDNGASLCSLLDDAEKSSEVVERIDALMKKWRERQ